MIIEAESCWDFPVIQDNLDMSPQATHELYVSAEDWPEMDIIEAKGRLDQFRAEGYETSLSVLCLQPVTVQQALRMEVKANVLLAEGGLIGPYLVGERIVQGIRIFRRQPEDIR